MPLKKAAISLMVAISLIVASTPRPVQAITRGYEPAADDMRFDAVAAFSRTNWLNEGHNTFGNAILIAPNVIVFAKHLLPSGSSGYRIPNVGEYSVRFRRQTDGTLGTKSDGSDSFYQVKITTYEVPQTGDLAIAFLETPVLHIQPIKPLMTQDIKVDDPLIVAGWGKIGPAFNNGDRGWLRLADTTAFSVNPSAVNFQNSLDNKAGANMYDSGGGILWIDPQGQLRLAGTVQTPQGGTATWFHAAGQQIVIPIWEGEATLPPLPSEVSIPYNQWTRAAGSPGAWTTSGNWTGGLPTITTFRDSHIDNGGIATVGAGQAAVANMLYLGYRDSGEVIQNGGSMALWSTSSGRGEGLFMGFYEGASGEYRLNDGTLTSPVDVIGHGGSGLFVQSGGTHMVFNSIYLGYNDTGSGRYELGGGVIATQNLSIGYRGEGTFVQTGGTAGVTWHTVLGEMAGGEGAALIEGGSLTTDYLTIGRRGAGHFNQTGSSAQTTVNKTLILGEFADALGTAQLSGGSITANALIAGRYGAGTWLIDGGTLTTGSTVVGQYGVGSFDQQGGLHITGTLELGAETSGSGHYALSGGGLQTPSVKIGMVGAGTFEFSGGTLDAGFLEIGPQGSMTFTGGAMTLASGLSLSGTLDFAGAPVDVVFGQGLIDFSAGTLAGGANTTVTLESGAVMLVASDADPANWFGTFVNRGLVHQKGSTLVVEAGSEFVFSGTFPDPVVVHGAMSAPQGGQANLTGGLWTSGAVDLGGGTLDIGRLDSGMSNALLAGGTLRVGVGGEGRFTQASGASAFNELVVGASEGHAGRFVHEAGQGQYNTVQVGAVSSGRYELLNGSLDTASLGVGVTADGEFLQNGGSVTIAGTLALGRTAGVTGAYSMSGGELVASGIDMGEFGVGRFQQSGSSALALVARVGAPQGGSAVLTAAGGQLDVWWMAVGDYSGTGQLVIEDPAARIRVGGFMLQLGPNASVQAAPGSRIDIGKANVELSSTNAEALAGLGNITMAFNPVDTAVYDIAWAGDSSMLPALPNATLEVAGANLGATFDGFHNNFALGGIEVGLDDPLTVQLVNKFDNQPGWGGGEALYVKSLTVGEGATFDLAGQTVYYVSLKNLGGDILLGGGQLVPVYMLGDFNGDGVLSGLDIPGFKAALADPDGWASATGRDPLLIGDFSADGQFSGLDIPGFKTALAGSAAAVPEPATLLMVGLAIAGLVRQRRRIAR